LPPRNGVVGFDAHLHEAVRGEEVDLLADDVGDLDDRAEVGGDRHHAAEVLDRVGDEDRRPERRVPDAAPVPEQAKELCTLMLPPTPGWFSVTLGRPSRRP
jgi:hypothetical protein